MFINGRWLSYCEQFPVYNPATGEHLGNVCNASLQDVQSAIHAASDALPAWSSTTAYQRSGLLHAAHECVLQQKEELAILMTREQGKPLAAAKNEVQYAADFLLWFAEEGKRIYGETIPSARPDHRFLVQYQPVGVVAAITPWNYPISMITRKIAPALAAGCTIVLKPAEATPLCAIALFKIFEQVGIPAGVVNLITVQNPRPTGKEFCTNPQVNKLTFTGSTATGRLLATDAAPSFKRVSMELGGHAPFLVFEDADPVRAAKGVSLVKFLNTGQACISPNRIFVHETIAQPFIDTLKQRIETMQPGNGLKPGVNIGPLVNAEALDKVQQQVEDAVSRGAKCLCGGQRLMEAGMDKGYFYAPTLLTEVTPDMLIYKEETFGPVAPIITFNDQDDIISMANDTEYGLAAYIYTQSLSRAMKTFDLLHFGIIGINDINPTSAAVPFGGMKNSGLGREGAREGIMEYLETKCAGIML
ncbi:NAD-dependent succinate-semialdehyde dehydrogenase [Desulfogranum japonicum]|uniref:NAD-dependent succinate-semialdehyde dehydrogenase n=1 Tax=Desulfogranum japonicum TaxID=231447 RepID=UPI00040C9D15|nr:NAD-dependent succinate-semialdehyde dehydrogenase [Desulfogranum japonicum]